MNQGKIKQGQMLSMVLGPQYANDDQVCVHVGRNGVAEIEVGQLRGPMGFYDVAIVRFDDRGAEHIHPLHMMDTIEISPIS